MADPVFVTCPKGIWTKVATNVTTGQIWKRPQSARFLQTYRITATPAPTERSEGVEVFSSKNVQSEPISATGPIDVYLYAIDKDGEVRVDI